MKIFIGPGAEGRGRDIRAGGGGRITQTPSKLPYLIKWQCSEHVFLFQLTLKINITLINIALRILEKNKIKSVLRAIRSC